MRPEIVSFLSGWDWTRVTEHLENCYKNEGVGPDDLFQEIEVCDPDNPYGRARQIVWAEKDEVKSEIYNLQKHLIQYPGTHGTNPYHYRAGENETLQFLWQFHDAGKSILPILVGGSLFPRIDSSRSSYPYEWVPVYCVVPVRDWAYEAWDDNSLWDGISAPWHHTRTYVLPYFEDREPKVDSMYSLVEFLADEHIELFHTCRALRVNFVPRINPFLKKRIHRELGWPD